MSLCVRYAGDSYTYLLDSVTTDHGRAGATPMTRYYAAEGAPPGTWLGAGLAGLDDDRGLAPGSAVTPVQMERLFASGLDPVSGQPLGQSPHVYSRDADRRRPVAGFDCTFTAAKSVSVLWALADHPTREAIYACHRQAIADVLAVIERDVARTRIGTDGVAQVETRGVVAAAFDHWDSRENDPNLHTHVVIANRVQGPDGRWRTLDSRALHRAAVAMSERYDSALADRITARLGLAWEYRERGPRRNPAYELAAVPQPLVEAFSRRANVIDAETDRLVAGYVEAHGRQPSTARCYSCGSGPRWPRAARRSCDRCRPSPRSGTRARHS
jgi:conjugative relaxase-like TrwC/TraI family protein